MPALHVASALGYYSAVKSMVAEVEAEAEAEAEADGAAQAGVGVGREVNEHEPLLSRCPLHLAAAAADPRLIRLLISHSAVEIEARDASGRTALEMVRCMLDAIDEGLGNAAVRGRLAEVR